MSKSIEKVSWNEFRNDGMLWFINMILHTFGYVIVVDKNDEGEIINAYPAKTKLRGFDEESNTRGYQNIARYIKDNAERIFKDTLE